MIPIEYEQALVEQAVRLAARRDPSGERALHVAIDPLYEIEDDDRREGAFNDAFRAWFVRLRLQRFLQELLSGCPLIGKLVARVVVQAAARRKGESAELFVRRDATDSACGVRTLVIRLCPESLAQPQRVYDRMERELLHVEDMLDARFLYEPTAIEGPPGRQQAVRERYRLLWDIYVEVRLSRRGGQGMSELDRLRRAFEQHFLSVAGRLGGEAFELFCRLSHVTHPQLLGWAEDFRAMPGAGEAGPVAPDASPQAGDACPVCGFPTFDWFDFRSLSTREQLPPADIALERPTLPRGSEERLLAAIAKDKPDWTPSSGLCRQCAETFVCKAALTGC